MGTFIKHTTSNITGGFRMGDIGIGVGGGLGPTSTTNYWTGIEPPSGKYVIYSFANGTSGNPRIYVAQSDPELIWLATYFGGTSIVTATDALVWFYGQPLYQVMNVSMGDMVTSGMTFHVDSGLVSCWPRSGDMRDMTNTVTGATIPINTPTYSATHNALELTGTNYMKIPANIFSTTKGTISIWWKVTTGGGGMIIGTFGGGSNRAPTIYTNTAANNILWEFADAFSQPSGVDATTNLWYHTVMTWDVTANNQVFFYVNNSLTNPGGTNPTGGISVWQPEVHIGHYHGFGSNFFIGAISEVTAYNRVLSGTEVTQIWNASRVRYGR